jgi:transcriptional antiterminator NusG
MNDDTQKTETTETEITDQQVPETTETTEAEETATPESDANDTEMTNETASEASDMEDGEDLEDDEDPDDDDDSAPETEPKFAASFVSKTRGKQAKNTGRNWYVIHTYSGYEDAVEKALRQRIETFNMQDLIFDVVVPKESSISIKKGSHVTEKIRMFPGYVLIDMIVTDDSWYVVRNTPNVTGFVGAGTIPVPVLPEEFDRIQRHSQQDEPKFKINFQVGENVQIADGPFKDCDGMIDAVDEKKGRVKVLVNVFGRETPVELEFGQVKKKV